ncbi:MAG TPA: MFS transporter [Candidatus Limnocylindrales bacterium]|nr:MFS transporter [Candidatus Limnocylindrales bacterium]
MTHPAVDPARLPALRRRMVWTLFAVSALGSTGYIAAVTAGTLAAADIGGTAAPGGLPTATSTLGTAAAAALLSFLMLRIGRRPGLLLGILVGTIGAGIAVVGVLAASLPLLLVGSALTGFANGAGQLGRYIAADLASPERRATTIGTVVWGATIGAVGGPNLVAPAGVAAESLGLPPLAGSYLLTFGFVGLAWVIVFVFLRPEPYELADPSALAAHPEGTEPASVGAMLGSPSVLVALVTLAAGQVVMVLIMTMTPLHLTDHGHGLATVGIVLSAHTFGMFALSPITGRLVDRFGSPRIIAAGLVTLAIAALIAAGAPPDGGAVLALALFLLGYGWNLGFVAGSSLLTSGLALGERTRIQGVADGIIWSSAALASLASGFIVAGASFTTLGLLGVGLLIPPAAVLLARLRAVTAGRPAT